MKTNDLIQVLMLVGFVLVSTAHAQMDAPIAVNVQNAPIRSVLETVAERSGLQLVMDQQQEPNMNVSLSQTGMTARQILDKLATDQQIEYTIQGSQLIVSKRHITGSGPQGDAQEILLKYAGASELVLKLAPIVGADSKVLADESSNKLIFIGSAKTFEKVKALVKLFDAPQKQIMIEALIVETSHSYLEQLGVSTAFLGDSTQTAGSTSPNGTFKTAIGILSGRSLDISLTAAESKGDAKVVSRPKVITLNNKIAKIQSGLTYNVRTLSSVIAPGSAAAQNTSGVLTGGITSIEAGLSLNILPSIVGEESIRLVVDINDSQPDNASAVDGIPGILTNAANTTVIVKNKQTAVIAGLIKKEKTRNSDGVPFLSDIPLLGLLFKSKSVSDQNNELVIFLTPTMGDPENTVPLDMSNIQNAAVASEKKASVYGVEATRDVAEDKEKISGHP
jgi:type IV pilus assembly protein PilQ